MEEEKIVQVEGPNGSGVTSSLVSKKNVYNITVSSTDFQNVGKRFT